MILRLFRTGDGSTRMTPYQHLRFGKMAGSLGILFMWLATPTPAFPQNAPVTAGPGAHVRLTISPTLTSREILELRGAGDNVKTMPAPGETLEGVILAIDDRLVSIQVEGHPTAVAVPRRAIATLEKAVGRRSRARYAGLGAVLGTGIGALLATALTDCTESWCLVPPAAPGAVLGAGAGAVAGAIVTPPRRWISVGEPSLVSIPEAPDAATETLPPPRVRVALQFGVTSSGPARDFEETMRRNGFGDTSSGFGHAIAHPVSDTGFESFGPSMLLEMHYGVRAPWTLAFRVSRAPIGETRGYRADGFQYLTVQYQAVSADLVLSRDFGPVRLGTGPAWHRAQVRESSGGSEQPWTSTSRVGIVAVAGARLPTTTRVYLDVSVQYRFVGSMSVGPFTTANPFFPATLPASKVQFSHWLVGFGPGIRF